jgi:DNA-binding NarL/FixJ family response regulator
VRLRCLIIDDSPQLLDAARALLELQGISVVGVATTTAQALQQVHDLTPDVALIDIELGTESGLDLAHRLRRETSLPPSQVILISAHAHHDMIDLITTAPAAAFLTKSHLTAHAIHEILGDTDA